jgi:hypothetical protein
MRQPSCAEHAKHVRSKNDQENDPCDLFERPPPFLKSEVFAHRDGIIYLRNLIPAYGIQQTSAM